MNEHSEELGNIPKQSETHEAHAPSSALHGEAKRQKKRKWYSLIDKVWREDNLNCAFEQVAQNHGAAGIDQVSIEEFLSNKEINLREIQRLLREKRYTPHPVRRVEIPKANGSMRQLGIPTVRDRIVQCSMRNVMEPIFESKFMDCSYGYRPNKSCQMAINKIREHIQAGCSWVVELDIQNFFDTLDHRLLMDGIREEISDGSLLDLLEAFLQAGVIKEGKLVEQKEGTPQGGVISPLLANIYLHPLDESLVRQGYNLVRYADDLVLLCKSEQEANKALEAALEILQTLKLSANHSKTRIRQITDKDGFDFLGFQVNGKYTFPADKSIRQFREKVRCKTRRTAPVSIQKLIQNLNPLIRGWGNYFRWVNSYRAFKQLDSWIRMRLRCFLDKRKSKMANYRYAIKFFETTGLASLISLRQASLLVMGQRHPKAGCVNSARPV